MVQTVKFLIVEPSLPPILIPLGPKYFPRDPFYQIPLACFSSLNVRDHISPYSTAGNIIVNYIFFFFLFNLIIILTPWLIEPGGSVPHSRELSNNSYPEPN